MCEIDITDFVMQSEPFDFSRSIAEAGANAGPNSWCNAMREAAATPLLKTEDELDALRQWARETGAWEKSEIAAWDAVKCNALFIQMISGDMRDARMDECDLEDFDWDTYRERTEQGQVSGNLYEGAGKRIYFYLGS